MEEKDPTYNRWVLLICFALMSIYIVYEHATSCLAIDLATQIGRHKNLVAGQSEFFNPWQYRIFSPFLLEGMIGVYKSILPGKPEIGPYLLLRFLQNMAIFYLAFYYYKALGIRNPLLVFSGLVILGYSISNSTFKSDLSFNTYFDIIFYLAGALLILRKNYVWILPLSIVAALNRETSGFIPLMLIVPLLDKKLQGASKREWAITGISLVAFFIVWLSIRLYYGFQPAEGIHGMTSMKDFFLYNVRFVTMYFQLLGTFSVVPVIVLIGLSRLPSILQRWFWLIVPLWVFIHLVKSTAIETRLFLVPMTLIFVPALLWLIEDLYSKKSVTGLQGIGK